MFTEGQNVRVNLAGIRAVGFKTDDDFGEQEMRRLNIKRGPPIEADSRSSAINLFSRRLRTDCTR